MVTHDDEALHRLRASDPATGSHPDLHTLRRRIAQKAPASQGEDTATRLTDDMFRSSSRVPWIAAAVVAAFGFGAGGYAIGAQQAPDGGGTLVAGQEDSEVGDAQNDGSVAGEGTASTSVPEYSGGDSGGYGGGGPGWDPGPVRLVAGPGLSTEHGTAEVRALVSEQDPDTFLEEWAAQLGFEGVRAKGNPEDGTTWFGGPAIYDPEAGQVLSASNDGGGGALSFSFEDMFSSPWCTDSYRDIPADEMDRLQQEWAAAFGEEVAFPDASRCTPVEGEAPSKDEALQTATDFFATAGLDVSGYTLTVPDYQDGTSNIVMVEGWPENQQYGHLTVNAQVGPQGVVSAYGQVGEMTSLGDYPLISAAEAVERYGQREFGMEYGVTLVEDMQGATEAKMPVEEPFELPDPTQVQPGMKIPMLLKDKVVVDAELSRGSLWGNTTGPLEVPTWKLITEDGMHYAVLALADEAIDWQSWESTPPTGSP